MRPARTVHLLRSINDVTAKYELIGSMVYPIRHSYRPKMQKQSVRKGLPYTHMAFAAANTTFASAIEGLKSIKNARYASSMPKTNSSRESICR